MKNYLEFEKEIKLLETDLDSLKSPFGSEGISEVDTQKIRNTEEEINNKLRLTYENLNSWQKTLVARHEDRPKAKFFIDNLFEDFISLEHQENRQQFSHRGTHVDINVFDTSDIHAAIEELKRVKSEFETLLKKKN